MVLVSAWEVMDGYYDGDEWHPDGVVEAHGSSSAALTHGRAIDEGEDCMQIGVRSADGEITVWLVTAEHTITYTADLHHGES